MTENHSDTLIEEEFVLIQNVLSPLTVSIWKYSLQSKICSFNCTVCYRVSPTTAAVIFLLKTITERRLWRGGIVCVALNKVCMTHASCGLKQSKQPPLWFYPHQLSSFLSHFFTVNVFLSSIHVNPSRPSGALSHVSLQRTTAMAQCYAGAAVACGCGVLALRHQAQPGSDRPSCLSQDLCPCCQFRVLQGGKERGEVVLAWTDKNRRCKETQSGVAVEAGKGEMFSKCCVRGREVIETVSWVSSDRHHEGLESPHCFWIMDALFFNLWLIGVFSSLLV